MSKRQQSRSEIERFYSTSDPWGYFNNPDDAKRKEILMSVLADYSFSRALDIGCGNGFITESIPAESVVGIDIAQRAIDEAIARRGSKNIDYQCGSIFGLKEADLGEFDLVLITGVLYEQYIGESLPYIYRIVDEHLKFGGLLVLVHIDEWCFARFPYARIQKQRYKYRSYNHLIEVYRK